MLPLSNLLTVIITTSPVPSNPSVDLISSVIASFKSHCSDLAATRIVVVFDTHNRITAQARLKKGQVTLEGVKNFKIYKANAKQLIFKVYHDSKEEPILSKWQSEAEFGSEGDTRNIVGLEITQTQGKGITFVEPRERLGFGIAVRSALRLVDTPYVWIQQHDWALVADIPVRPLLDIMQASESDVDAPIKYVCFPSIRMLSYATSAHVADHAALRQLTSVLKRDFSSTVQPEQKITLTPLFLWHDKPHLASTSHYLARCFPSRLAMRRGDFIEDTVGRRARMQMKEGQWTKWASWLYYPGEGRVLCLRHLKGRTWKGDLHQLAASEAFVHHQETTSPAEQ